MDALLFLNEIHPCNVELDLFQLLHFFQYMVDFFEVVGVFTRLDEAAFPLGIRLTFWNAGGILISVHLGFLFSNVKLSRISG